MSAMIRQKVGEMTRAKGMSLAKLARRTGLGYSTVIRLAADPHRNIDIHALHKIARVLGVETKDLLEDEPDTQPLQG